MHAGVIESGHFRFHVVGERILHLDVRLFYKRRGLEAAAAGHPLATSLAYAQRACAACAVTNSVAYAQACEQALGLAPDRELRRAAHAAARARTRLQPPPRHLRDLRRRRLRRRHDGLRDAEGTRAAPQRAPHRSPLPVPHGARRRQRPDARRGDGAARSSRAARASRTSTRARGASSSSRRRSRHAWTASASSPAMTPTGSAPSARRPAPPASPATCAAKARTCGTTSSSRSRRPARPATSPAAPSSARSSSTSPSRCSTSCSPARSRPAAPGRHSTPPSSASAGSRARAAPPSA